MRIGAGSDSTGSARRPGQTLAAFGGVGLLGSLWLPWYTARASETAWQTFTAMPTVLLVTAAIVVALSVLELCQRTGDTSPLTMLAGGLAAVLVGYRVGVPPLPALHPAWGIYVALASAVAALGGGALAVAERSLSEIAVPAITLGQTPAPRVPSHPAR